MSLASLISGLKNHFRPAADFLPYYRAVQIFRVTDKDMQRQIIDIMKDQAENSDLLFKRMLSEPSRIKEIFADHLDPTIVRRNPAKELNALIGWTATPASLNIKGHDGYASSIESGVEVIVRKGTMYLTVPAVEHIKNEHENCDDVLAAIEAWQPPADLAREDNSLLLGRNPIGFPRIGTGITLKEVAKATQELSLNTST